MATASLSLSDRLEHGALTVAEICFLRPCSRSKFYSDVRDGRVPIVKRGRRTVVLGPAARRYLAGGGAASAGN